MPVERQFSLRTERRHFASLYRIVNQICNELAMSADEQFRFGVCISEAFTNAFLHGNDQDSNKSIKVRFAWTSDQVRVDIEDEGNGSLSQADLTSATAAVPAESCDGRGIGIIKKYADRITIEPRQEGGLKVSIFWNLTKQSTNTIAAR